MLPDNDSIDSGIFAVQHDEHGSVPTSPHNLVKRFFVLLQRTLVNYSVCIDFLTTDIRNYSQLELADASPPQHVFDDAKELLRSVYSAHDTIKEIYDFMLPEATLEHKLHEYRGAHALFMPFSHHMSRALSRFESVMVDEETHMVGDIQILASSSNFKAVLGCALLRPLAQACGLIDASIETLAPSDETPDHEKHVLDAINEACRIQLYLFCRHFRARVTDLCNSADYQGLQMSAMHLRLGILAQVVRGFDPEEDRSREGTWESPAKTHGITPPSDSPTSTILADSWSRISGTLEASIPYARPNVLDDSEDDYDNTILRAIHAREGTSFPHMASDREKCILDLLQSLVFFLDMVPMVMRLSQRLYWFRGVISLPKKWETLAESVSTLRAGLVRGGSNSLADDACVRDIANSLCLLTECLTLAVTENKWPPSVAAGPVLDGFLELSVAMEMYLECVMVQLDNDKLSDAWVDLDTSARAALFELYDMRYQTMYDLAGPLS